MPEEDEMADNEREIHISDEQVLADAFRSLRVNYPARFSFARYKITDSRLSLPQINKLRYGLKIQVEDLL